MVSFEYFLTYILHPKPQEIGEITKKSFRLVINKEMSQIKNTRVLHCKRGTKKNKNKEHNNKNRSRKVDSNNSAEKNTHKIKSEICSLAALIFIYIASHNNYIALQQLPQHLGKWNKHFINRHFIFAFIGCTLDDS